MKKLTAVVISLLLAQGIALAAERGTPEYEKLKEYKKTQKAQKEAEKANPQPKAKGFWAREAERSGFAGTGAMFSNGIARVVPLDKPKAWKETQ